MIRGCMVREGGGDGSVAGGVVYADAGGSGLTSFWRSLRRRGSCAAEGGGVAKPRGSIGRRVWRGCGRGRPICIMGRCGRWRSC